MPLPVGYLPWSSTARSLAAAAGRACVWFMLAVALSSSASSSEAQERVGEVRGGTIPGRNPILETFGARPQRPPADEALPDFRQYVDPRLRRHTAPTGYDVPVFGASFFEAPRSIIAARRRLLRDTLGAGIPETPAHPVRQADVPEPAPSQSEIDAVAGLTDAGRLGILERHAQGQLGPAEIVRYRLLLTPGLWEQYRPPTAEEQRAIDALTDERRVDLVLRLRDGTLTPQERTLYRAFLNRFPQGAVAAGPSGAEAAALRRLSSSAREDLERRRQAGRLTAAERATYPWFAAGGALPAADEPYLDPAAPVRAAPPRPNRSPGAFLGDGDRASDARRASLRSAVRRAPRTGADPWDEVAPRDVVADGLDPSDAYALAQPLTLPTVDAFRQVADPLAAILQAVIASPPPNYELGPDDRLTLRYWSPTIEARQTTVTVDSTGGITLPAAGRVVVRGQTLAQAEATVRDRMRRNFREVEVSLTLDDLRTIQVTVAGASYFPGTYTVPAVASAFNLLYATGGPTDDGSYRRIEVRRRGATVGTLDLYRLLVTGDQTGDISLQPGDMLFIPDRSTRVAVKGLVRRPARFELAPDETIADALRFAGGTMPAGVTQRAQLTTVIPGAARVTRDVDLAAPGSGPQPQVLDGDVLEVFSVRPTVMNMVTVEGAVDQPGEYAIEPGMRVRDLIERARGLLPEAHASRADLFRHRPDDSLELLPLLLDRAMAGDPEANLALRPWDRVKVYTRAEVAWTGRRDVSVRGAVMNPGVYYRSENMRVSDLLLQAGGVTPDAAGDGLVLLHQKPDGRFAYRFLSLTRTLAEDPEHNPILQDRDVLAVYRAGEAAFAPERQIEVRGEVTAPGFYPRGEGMRLSDALRLAGGLTPSAGDAVQVTRARSDERSPVTTASVARGLANVEPDPALTDGDIVTVQGRGAFMERPILVTVRGAVNKPGPVALTSRTARLTDALQLAGGLRHDAFAEGSEFFRDPSLLATAGQRQLTAVITRLNEIVNDAAYQRELARSDVEKMRTLGASVRALIPIEVPGLGGAPAPEQATPAPGEAAASLFRRELVTEPRRLRADELAPQGNVAVNLQAAMRRPAGDEDIVLLDGDVITVPETPTTVQVVGAVVHARGVLYRPGARIDHYVQQVGGLAPDAALDRAIIVRIGGGVVEARRAREIRPGDVIVIPTQVMAQRITNRMGEIDTVLRSLTNSTILVMVAKRLLGL
ncbi:MAG TPA: SLBB domain-containing protein [Chthonomonadales bacterium]|nr:SLBB domain-containing protein [Chthonomonadales bacterium]